MLDWVHHKFSLRESGLPTFKSVQLYSETTVERSATLFAYFLKIQKETVIFTLPLE